MKAVNHTTTNCAVLLAWCLGAACGQTPPPCDDAQVQYRPAPSEVAHKIRVTRPSSQPALSTSARKLVSPQGTRWFFEVDPDYTSTKEPWNTILFIHRTGETDRVLRLDVMDHGNTFTASWINEKLLFVEVWWGRRAASDVILDIDQGKIMYHEMANYSEIIQPCSK
jgi:hypothetical protein